MDCTYFQNKWLFSIFILSLSHDLVLGTPVNVVFVCVLELLNTAVLCLPKACWWGARVGAGGNAALERLEMRWEFQASARSVMDLT